jgi:hypothetical protein
MNSENAASLRKVRRFTDSLMGSPSEQTGAKKKTYENG